jgi:hypothetical protein
MYVLSTVCIIYEQHDGVSSVACLVIHARTYQYLFANVFCVEDVDVAYYSAFVIVPGTYISSWYSVKINHVAAVMKMRYE